LAEIGSGCPDLLVGFRGKNFLLEVKDGNLPPSKCRLTDDEEEFFRIWRGAVSLVSDPAEALRLVCEES
jgi:hypothetical protein